MSFVSRLFSVAESTFNAISHQWSLITTIRDIYLKRCRTFKVPFSWDLMLRQWLIWPGPFDATLYPHLQWCISCRTCRHVKMRTLLSSESLDPLSNWRSVMSKKNGFLIYTAAKTSELADSTFVNSGTVTYILKSLSLIDISLLFCHKNA